MKQFSRKIKVCGRKSDCSQAFFDAEINSRAQACVLVIILHLLEVWRERKKNVREAVAFYEKF